MGDTGQDPTATSEDKTLEGAVAEELRALAARKMARNGELAESTGIEQSRLSKMMRGRMKMSFTAADVIAQHLGTSLEAVIKAALENNPDLPRKAPATARSRKRDDSTPTPRG